ncbi:hypothetical protein [Chitinophaga tropicalis]|uniref:Uncharacterized protein n=1 Tax=Chitinophaga tropicalis TaxID=2683588 RepID=A0A7K1UDH4_9BACT|nr:hypothetical protein [Chitinophaga tropicalis]MVT12366.1 hypothetical protein [Chitinophaga tropicalis]
MDSNIQEFVRILGDKIKQPHEWNSRNLCVTNFDNDTYNHLRNVLQSLHIPEEGDQDELIFNLNQNAGADNLVFYDQKHFQSENSYERYKDCWQDVNIIILMPGGEVAIKEKGEQFGDRNLPIYNYLYYRKILAFLLSKPEFTSLHYEMDQQFAILSAEKGPFHIGYSLAEIRVATAGSLMSEYEELVKGFDKMEFAAFFKDVVIEGTHAAVVGDRFWKLVSNLAALTSLANRDLQIYLQKFAFEKIKSKFKEEKVKYFESLEKNIESLNKQVLAFPLTFAASVFAGFQVKDSFWILIVIFASYALYTFVAWKILGLIKYNIDTTEQDVKDESNRIRTTYQVVYSEFQGDFNKINGKILLIKQLHKWLRGILVGLLVLFLLFTIGYSMKLEKVAQETAAAALKAKEDSLQRAANKVIDTFQVRIVSSAVKPVPVVIDTSANKKADEVHLVGKANKH